MSSVSWLSVLSFTWMIKKLNVSSECKSEACWTMIFYQGD